MKKWYPFSSKSDIGYGSDISRSDADTNGCAKMDTVTDKLNGFTYITFYLIYNNIKCDTYYNIIVYISMLSLYPLSFDFHNNGLHDL